MTAAGANHLQEAADILGTKWTALILYEMSQHPKRFCEVERSIPSINPRTLSKRLDELRSAGIITNCHDDPEYSDTCYRLTDKGAALVPILKRMEQWGKDYPRPTTWNIA